MAKDKPNPKPPPPPPKPPPTRLVRDGGKGKEKR